MHYNLFRGFVLHDDKYIGKNIFEELLSLNSGHDFKLVHKLTNKHLFVEGTGRMNVKSAAQLFSKTVAKAISFCGENKYFNMNNWKEVNIFIKIVSIISLNIKY